MANHPLSFPGFSFQRRQRDKLRYQLEGESERRSTLVAVESFAVKAL